MPALIKVIKAKAAGKKLPQVSGKPTPPTKVVDLVTRLKESLAAAQRHAKPSKGARPAARKRATATRKKSAA